MDDDRGARRAAAPSFYNLNTNGSFTQVTFHAPGHYTFQVTVTDSAGLSATSSVNVSVAQVLQLAVTPNLVFVPEKGTQQFGAVLQDQFGTAMSSPTITWSATAGTITSSGLSQPRGHLGMRHGHGHGRNGQREALVVSPSNPGSSTRPRPAPRC